MEGAVAMWHGSPRQTARKNQGQFLNFERGGGTAVGWDHMERATPRWTPTRAPKAPTAHAYGVPVPVPARQTGKQTGQVDPVALVHGDVRSTTSQAPLFWSGFLRCDLHTLRSWSTGWSSRRINFSTHTENCYDWSCWKVKICNYSNSKTHT